MTTDRTYEGCYFCHDPITHLDSRVVDIRIEDRGSSGERPKIIGGANARACYVCIGRVRQLRLGALLLQAIHAAMPVAEKVR